MQSVRHATEYVVMGSVAASSALFVALLTSAGCSTDDPNAVGASSSGATSTSSSSGGSSGTSGSSSGTSGNSPDASGVDAAPGVRAVTNAKIVFDGTETDLKKYSPRIDDNVSNVTIAADPKGVYGNVLRFRRSKAAEFSHSMERPLDKTTNYQDAAQVVLHEKAYHYKQKFYVTGDPQYTNEYMNFLEDFHCEPCEANNMQIYTSYVEDNSVCMMINYSTSPSFDPRGLNRGSNFDPWPTLSANRIKITLNPDGTATLPGKLPETGALQLCRSDLKMSDLFDRWVDIEMLVKPSAGPTGTMRLWIDGKPYFYLGPNTYRYNQDRPNDSLAVNNFQFGLYGPKAIQKAGTPNYFELYTTPPRIETGDDILYTP